MFAPSSICAALLLPAQSGFVVDEPDPIPLVVVHQTRVRGPLGAQEIADELDAALRRDTGFSAELVPSELVRAELEAPPQPGVDVLGRVSRLAASRTKGRQDRALVLFYTPYDASTAALSLVYFRPRDGLAVVERLRSEDPNWRSVADENVMSKAIPPACTSLVDTLVTPLQVRGEAELRAALQRLVAEHMKACFEAEGAWRPFASIELALPQSGFELEIDGRSIGVAPGTTVTLERVRSGARQLSARHPDFTPWQSAPAVSAEGELRLAVDAVDLRAERAKTARGIVRWSAVGLGVLGLASLAVGIAKAGSQRDSSCIEFAGGSCSIESYERLAGVPLLPLGLGLTTSALVGGAGTYVEGPTRAPWISAVLGLASGVAVFFAVLGAE